MNNYLTKKLGEVGKYINGRAFKPSDWCTTGFPIIRIQNLNKKTAPFHYCGDEIEERYHVYNGDILISWSASLGVYVWNRGEALLNQHIFKVVLDEKMIDRRYFVHVVGTKIDEMSSKTHGATMRHIIRSKFLEIQIPLPPIDKQRRIVAKLEKVLGKIKEAKKLREEAEVATNSLLAAELHKILKNGQRKEWEEKAISEVAELNPSKAEIKNTQDKLLVSFVPMSAVDEYLQEIKGAQERQLGDIRKGYTYFKNGDVLFAKITPCMENGKIAIARNLKNGLGLGTTEFHVIRPSAQVLPEWIYSIIRQPFFRDLARSKMTGSAGQKRVPAQFLEKFKIPLPPLVEQKKIVARLDALSEKIKKLQEYQKQTQTDMVSLERSILSKVFIG